METSEAKEILLKCSAIWTRQPTDDAIQAEWAECLSRVSFESALETVRNMRDAGRPDAPTPGEIYRDARDRDLRWADESRRRTLRLVDRSQPTEAERANVRKIVREFEAKVGRKM